MSKKVVDSFPLQENDDEDIEEELGDRRARCKKEVDYTESLTEKEWLRAIGVSVCRQTYNN